MRIRPLHKLLLAAVLVFGQWLAVAHDYQHPALDGNETCQVCVHGPGFQAGPSATPALAVPAPTVETRTLSQTTAALARRHTPAAIRAPPVSLV
jgi:hypothetical protein